MANFRMRGNLLPYDLVVEEERASWLIKAFDDMLVEFLKNHPIDPMLKHEIVELGPRITSINYSDVGELRLEIQELVKRLRI